MRKLYCAYLICLAAVASQAQAADDAMPSITVPMAPAAAPAQPRHELASANLQRVADWIRQRVPECPADVALAAAKDFLDDLEQRSPDRLDHLLDPDIRVGEFESSLFRWTAVRLSDPAMASIREKLAVRRAHALLAQRGGSIPAARVAAWVASIRSLSETRYQSLLEGRMEDDDLAFYLKRAGETGSAVPAAAASSTGPGVNDILSEFVRHNATGAALHDLHAYIIEAKLKPATGEEQHLLLFKMRPDRFRLVVEVDGTARFVQASSGAGIWQQVSGRPVERLSPKLAANRQYLGEFADPLFGEEGYLLARLPDGACDGTPCYRISVRRPDDSSYVAQIDQKSYREIGREDSDGSTVQYSDFRSVGGITFAFREVATDRSGRKGVLQVIRITPNPGLTGTLFEPPSPGDQGFFAFDRILAAISPQPARTNP